MTNPETPAVGPYWKALDEALPARTPDEQRAAVALYREVAKGVPVTVAQVAGELDMPGGAVRELLDRDYLRALTYTDNAGRITGFGGLTVVPTHHRFEIDGRTLWTWCAWDGLFIPEILGATARLESADPETGEIIRLTVAPEGPATVEPESAVVSFLFPNAGEFTTADNVIASFCHFVFFFASRESGERWAERHEGTFLYSIEQAAELGRLANATNFGHELARAAS